MLRRLAAGTAVNTGVFAALLFVPAGTLGWWRGWVFLGVLVTASLAMTRWLYRHDQALLRERLRAPVQRGQPLVDRVVLLGFVAVFLAWMVFIPVDVFHLHLAAPPGPVVSGAGLVLTVAGLWLVHLSLRENTFAAPVVRHQRERGHRVIDSGAYGVVRHPMYAAILLVLAGMALWLESWAALALAPVPAGVLVVRVLVEERFLVRELPGYEAYRRRVRFRLVPFLW